MTAQSRQIVLYDTTLRDGTQQEGISLTVKDKLDITKKLDELGINIIEGGWPFSNPKDEEYFRRVRSLKLKTARIAWIAPLVLFLLLQGLILATRGSKARSTQPAGNSNTTATPGG